MKPRLILHIGTHKTATTTLQALMAQEREALAKAGFWYARTDRAPYHNKQKHAFFSRMLGQDRTEFDALHRSLLEEFEASGCHTLVLSAEGLSGPVLRTKLAPMAAFARDFDITSVCYLRRQDYFAEAKWNQGCKLGHETLTIGAFVQQDRVLEHMDYCSTLDHWGAYGAVTALGFETARESDVVAVFATATGMPLPAAPKSRNISPSMTCAAAMAVLNRQGTAYDWRKLERALGTDTSRLALGARLRAELLARFAEHNAKLRETYGVVFPDAMPEEPQDPIPEPGADQIVQLRAAMAAPGRRAKGGGQKRAVKRAAGGKRVAGGKKAAGRKGKTPTPA